MKTLQTVASKPTAKDGNAASQGLLSPTQSVEDGDPTGVGVLRDEPGQTDRASWANSCDFTLASIGYAVGLGNIWRFPYLCYNSGGGAFLIPYFIMLFMCGIPLLYMEYSVGQWTRMGPTGALKQLCPFFQGSGLATVMLSFLLATYYNVILAWALYYFGASFAKTLPWSWCDPAWASPRCWDNYTANNTDRPLDSTSPSQEYYENRVLQQSEGLEDFGTMRWELFGLLALAWLLVYLALWKGVKLTGKVVYFTALFPYVIIIVLLIRGLTLPGAELGIDFFIKPDWELLKTPKVWVNAAAQNFNSIGIAFGSMIAYSSYKKKNAPILRDVLVVTLTNSATSILCGFAIFSTLGYIAHTQGKNVTDVVNEGPGLVFIVYPEAFTTLPVSQLFSALFFFMLLCLAVDSQFANVEVVLTTIEDHLGVHLKKRIRREVLVLLVCLVAFVLSLPNIFNGGIYYFKIIDKYSSGISLMIIALFEVMAVSWFYGGRRLAKNVGIMTGSKPFIIFVICWYIISPLFILAIMIFNWVDYTPVTYGDYEYPDWGQGIGWMLASFSLICIPLGMIKGVWETPGDSIVTKFIASFHTLEDREHKDEDEVVKAKLELQQL